MKTIKFNLSSDSIQNAIDELNKYQEELARKCNRFCEELTREGLNVAESCIGESPLGSTISVHSELTEEETGCKGILIAIGETIESEHYAPFNTLLAVEFGAGIHYNRGNDNPIAGNFGMGVGTFPGQVHAFQDTWWYKGTDNKWYPAHGVKATMPMYRASVEMKDKVSEVARRIFKTNEAV